MGPLTYYRPAVQKLLRPRSGLCGHRSTEDRRRAARVLPGAGGVAGAVLERRPRREGHHKAGCWPSASTRLAVSRRLHRPTEMACRIGCTRVLGDFSQSSRYGLAVGGEPGVADLQFRTAQFRAGWFPITGISPNRSYGTASLQLSRAGQRGCRWGSFSLVPAWRRSSSCNRRSGWASPQPRRRPHKLLVVPLP